MKKVDITHGCEDGLLKEELRQKGTIAEAQLQERILELTEQIAVLASALDKAKTALQGITRRANHINELEIARAANDALMVIAAVPSVQKDGD